jgi:hypothetical protein
MATENNKDDLEIEDDVAVGEPIEIEIEADEHGKAAAETKSEPTVVKVEDDGIKSLKEQLAAEQRRRAEADNRARELADRVARAEADSVDGRLTAIDSAIEAANAERAAAKRDYADAMAAGDYVKAADAQEAIAIAANKHMRLESDRQSVEVSRDRPRTTEGRVTQQPGRIDVVEQVASGLPAKSAAWIRSHPECVYDQSLNSQMIGAHHMAVGKGIVPESAAYFDFIERTIGLKTEAQVADPEPEATTRVDPKPETKKAPVAAPVSRSAVSTSGKTGPRTVTLSPAEREFCDLNEIDYKQYARDKIALQNEGKINRVH